MRGTQALRRHQNEVSTLEQNKENLTQVQNKANIRQQEEEIARRNAEKFRKEKAVRDAEFQRIQDEIASKAKGPVTKGQMAGAGNKFEIIDYSNSNYHNDLIVKLNPSSNSSLNGFAAADKEIELSKAKLEFSQSTIQNRTNEAEQRGRDALN